MIRKNNISLLIVEDNPGDLRLVREMLRTHTASTWEVVTAGSLAEAFARVEERAFDAVLLDLGLPDSVGLATLQSFHLQFPRLPVVIMTGQDDEEIGMDAIRLGAGDYLVKGEVDERLLVRAIRYAIERKASEERLLESEEKHRRLFETMPQGVVYQTADGQILTSNLAAQKILGLTLDQMTGKSSVDPHWRAMREDGSDFPGEQHPSMESLRTGEPVTDVIMGVFNPEDDNTRWIKVDAVPLFRAGEPAPFEVYTTFDDVTEQKLAEKEKARTAEQLNHAHRMEVIGQLAGGVAHDFNNILTVILTFSDCVYQELSAGDPLRDDLQEVLDAARRATALTGQLLAFSRRQAIEPKPISPNEVIENLAKMLTRLIGENIELELKLGEPGRIFMDPTQLEQVVMNLAVNARDAIVGPGKLTISTENFHIEADQFGPYAGVEPGEYVKIQVRDTGGGIPPEALPRIFEPFFTTKDKGKGTGLGLAVVYGAVKQNSGHIEVESRLGAGTAFSVFLPRLTKTAKQVEDVADDFEVFKGNGETVLLVEDDLNVRKSVVRLLEKSGYRVLLAENGQEGLEKFKRFQSRINLVFTDVVMPVMDGIELGKRLRSIEPNLKIIYCSGYIDNLLEKHRLREDEIDIVFKPFQFTALLKTIKEVLER